MNNNPCPHCGAGPETRLTEWDDETEELIAVRCPCGYVYQTADGLVAEQSAADAMPRATDD